SLSKSKEQEVLLLFFQNKTSYEIKKIIKESGIAILPVGAVEAHGPHLPLGTDNLLAERVAEKVATGVDGLILPTLSYGQVWSLQNFPGSINISNDSMIRFLVDIGTSLSDQGFTTFVMINGHLGNQVELKEAARLLYEKRSNMKIYYFFYPGINEVEKKVTLKKSAILLYEKIYNMKVYYFFYPGMNEVVKEVRDSDNVHNTYFHACEIETSYMLYLAPEFVDMSKAINEKPNIPDTADVTPTPWEAFTDTAVLGDATSATEEKGKYIIDYTVQNMISILKNK